MATEKDLLNTIQALVEQKTFSLEGMEAIKKLRDKIDEHEKELKAKAEVIDRQNRANIELQAQIKEANDKVIKIDAREAALVVREKGITNLEIRTAIAEAIANTVERTVDKIFKNTIIRESVQRQVVTETPATYVGGLPMTHMRHGDSDTKTIEKE